MGPTWMRARSFLRQSLSRRSTERLLRFSSMSMKSMTISPARSRSRSWRETSSEASRLVLSAVSSMWCSRVARLGLVEHDVAAGAQLHDRREHGIELALDPVFGQDRLAVLVGLHVLGMAR